MDPQTYHVVRFDKGADLERNDAAKSAAIDLAAHRDALRINVYARIVHPRGQQHRVVLRQVNGQPTIDRPLAEDLAPRPLALYGVVKGRDLDQHPVALLLLRLRGDRKGLAIEIGHLLRCAVKQKGRHRQDDQDGNDNPRE